MSRSITSRSITSRSIVTGLAVSLACAGTTMALASPAHAHAGVSLYGATAKSGGYGAAFIRIPHGCDGDATNAVTVVIPAGIDPARVKPQQKPGWTITRTGESITWSGGSLADNEFDDFGMTLRWPTLAAGETQRVVPFPVTQTCDAEAKATRRGANIEVSASLPELAGSQVSVFAGDTRLARANVAADGTLKVSVPAAKAGTTPLTIHRGGALIATTVAAREAWVQVKGDGSDQSYPAPTVTVVAGTPGH